MKTKTCDCGQEIVFGILDDGKRVLVEFRTPVYTVLSLADDGTPMLQRLMQIVHTKAGHQATAPEDGKVCVNHFRTCPKAGQFTRGNP